jgi:hypothetical protein
MVMSICLTSRRFIEPRRYAAVVCRNDDDEHWTQCGAFPKLIPKVAGDAEPSEIRQNLDILMANALNQLESAIQYLLNDFAKASVLRLFSLLGPVTAVTAGPTGVGS